VLLDLDKFGSINKRHDHTVGDLLIARVGEVIRRNLRTEDVAGRLGGDEFAVLLPYTGKINAARVVNRLRTEIAKLSGKFEGAREEIPVSTSLGFETFDGSDLESLETLRRNAEMALRAAKRRGGNKGVYYRQPDAAEASAG
jgi:diguanylate cyclase (GGDEF)-like protein